MQLIKIVSAILLLMSLSFGVAAQQYFQKGLAAYESQDMKSAIKYWKKASKQNNAIAMYSLGLLYQQGKYKASDPQQAKKWYLRAAKLGFPQAEFKLAKLLLAEGDNERGVKWMLRAARTGYAHAQYDLAMIYHTNNEATEQEKEQALYWLYEAGKDGYSPAQYQLVLMYMKGRGVAQDNEKAFVWAKAASESGDPEAKYLLGYMYYSGTGTVQSDHMAALWLEEALEDGIDQAQRLLNEIEQRLSSL